MRICFWNTNRNNKINQYLKDVIQENNIDFVVLAEYKDNIEELKNNLSHYNDNFEEPLISGCERIKILAKNYISDPCYQNKYCSIQLVKNEFIFVCIHLPSKVHADEYKKSIVIDTILKEIHESTEKNHVDKTIIVGDFNENPYENGCLGAKGFHGMPSHEETLKGYRVIMDEKFAMFYNPMWNLMGDFSFPPGTFYYSGNEVTNPLWNMYDQVIISPNLKEYFVEDELKIIYRTKNYDLITKDHHPIKEISDHLPLIFEIREEKLNET